MCSDWQVKRFKRNFDLSVYVAQNFDVCFSGDRMYILCPFHEENTPSCLIDRDAYYCFGCGQYGDSISFLCNLHNINPEDVIFENWYTNDGNVLPIKSEKKRKSNKNYRTIGEHIVKKFHENLLSKPSKIAYLESRNVDMKTIKMARLGWGYPYGFRNFTKPRYFIPVYDENNKLVTVRYRIDPDYDDKTEPKYVGLPNSPSYIYNSSVLAAYKSVVIVGSELDAAFLYHRYGIPALAPPGENIFKREWAWMFINKKILLWFDSDIPGKEAMLKAYKILKPYAETVKIYRWKFGYPPGYDVGDYIKDYGIGAFLNELVSYELESYSAVYQ